MFLKQIFSEKWRYLIWYSFKQSNLKFSGFFLMNFTVVLDFLLTVYLWILIEPTPQRITYFLIGFMLQRLIWSQYLFTINNDIVSGKINNKVILPTPMFSFWLYREIGSSLFRNLLSALIILAFLPFFRTFLVAPKIEFLIVLPILLATGFFIDFCISYILASYAFFNEDFRPVAFFVTTIIKIFSGIVIPFSFLPQPLNSILPFNPYAWVNYHPMQIYLGNYDNVQTGWTLLGGVIWCIILYFLAKLVFKLGLKRNESVGL